MPADDREDASSPPPDDYPRACRGQQGFSCRREEQRNISVPTSSSLSKQTVHLSSSTVIDARQTASALIHPPLLWPRTALPFPRSNQPAVAHPPACSRSACVRCRRDRLGQPRRCLAILRNRTRVRREQQPSQILL